MEELKFNKLSHSLFFFGLALFIVGLPLSRFLMSLSQFILALAWLIDLKYINKLKSFVRNPFAIATATIFLLHIPGLLYSTDLNYALKDLRIKLPILTLPIILTGFPKLNRNQFKILLYLLVAAVLASTLISTGVLLGYTSHTVNNIRDISIFISHIRLSLLIDLSILLLFYHVFVMPMKLIIKALHIAIAFWLITFLIILESITGIAIVLFIGAATYSYYILRKCKSPLKYVHLFLLIGGISGIAYFLNTEVAWFYTTPPSPTNTNLTQNGRPYDRFSDTQQRENGQFVWMYVNEEELAKEWPKVCGTPYSGVDGLGNPVRSTLIRFLTSKNLTKDSAGIHQLEGEDIIYIEQGITNYRFVKKSNFKGRIYQIIWELDNYLNNSNPTGHSVTQRFEYWKAALHIIKSNPIIGVGTGDLALAYQKYYKGSETTLSKKWQLRSHNQFLAIAVATGIIGLIIFLYCFYYTVKHSVIDRNLYYLLFISVVLLSMITEDTLETQAGVSFFIYFQCLFLLQLPRSRSGS